MRRRLESALGAALICAALLGGLGGKAIAAPAICQPFDAAAAKEPSTAETSAQHVVQSVVGQLDGVPARTDYLDGGAYRTTECDDHGAPTRLVEMAPFVLPDGKLAELPMRETVRDGDMLRSTFAQRGDLRALSGDWRAAVADSTRTALPPLSVALLTTATPPAGMDPRSLRAVAASKRHVRGGIRFKRGHRHPLRRTRRPLAHAATTGDKCTLNEYAWSGQSWGSGYSFYVNWSAIGAPYRADFTTQTIYGGHTWQWRYNDCGWSQAQIFPTSNAGTTTLPVADGTGAVYRNGMNITDAGSLTNLCSGAVACTWTWGTRSTITQASTRLNIAMPWTIGVQPGFYDIWSVVAHERGHGMMNAGDMYAARDYWAIMYGYTYPNDATKRIMSLGDYSLDDHLYRGRFF